jgi:hypothetical protein
MEAKTRLQSIERQDKIILVNLLCFSGDTKFSSLEAIATKHAINYLSTHKLKVKRWAKIDVPGLANPSDWIQEVPELKPAYIAKFAYRLIKFEELN